MSPALAATHQPISPYAISLKKAVNTDFTGIIRLDYQHVYTHWYFFCNFAPGEKGDSTRCACNTGITYKIFYLTTHDYTLHTYNFD